MFRSRKRTEYITIASMENCPRLALEFGLRMGLELGFGGGGGGNFPRGQLSYSQPLVGFRKIFRRKIAPRLGLEFGLGIELELMLVGGNFPREQLS